MVKNYCKCVFFKLIISNFRNTEFNPRKTMRPGWYWNVVFCSIHFTSLSVGNCFISLGQSGPSLPNVSTFGIGYNNGILLCPRPVNSHFGSSPSYHFGFVYMDAIIAQHKKRAIIPIFRNYKFHKSSSAFGQYF